ncbi:MAG TPA: hypothetical protein VE999_06260, partial [Gemmataceae bacterium]|nr:hypothetical protein [Gemmataceae bacterium]
MPISEATAVLIKVRSLRHTGPDLLRLSSSLLVLVFGCRHDVAIRALRRPATEKRQGTKSREVGHWLSSE